MSTRGTAQMRGRGGTEYGPMRHATTDFLTELFKVQVLLDVTVSIPGQDNPSMNTVVTDAIPVLSSAMLTARVTAMTSSQPRAGEGAGLQWPVQIPQHKFHLNNKKCLIYILDSFYI